MNLFHEFDAVVRAALADMIADGALPEGLEMAAVAVQPPKDPDHGDLAANAAMVLAKPAGKKPRDIAEALAERLRADARVASAEVAGPGFLNIRLTPEVWRGLFAAVLADPENFGRSTLSAGKRVNVEYVSANPTGPLHVGHARGAIVGDALASLLAYAGAEVTREYYINDGGAQVDVLARSAYLRYREAHGEEVSIPEGYYPGDYLVPVGQALKERYGDALLDQLEEAWLEPVRDAAIDLMMATIKEDLKALGVEMDVFFSERSLYGSGRIEAALDRLQSIGVIYEGVLEPPKGAKPEDWEPREQTLFRSSDFGDDVDRPIKKSDGSWTYFAPDIAYHFDKVERGFDELIDIFGADHGGYVKRMQAAVGALTNKRVPLDIKLTQLVHLYEDGKPFKMSKRAGTFVTLRDVLEQVGPDVARFVMLMRKNDAPLDFDFKKALEQSKDNPVFYVQYAHARIASALREAAKAFGAEAVTDAALRAVDLAPLAHPTQLRLARRLAEWPRLVEAAASVREPHRVGFYLYDLASEFHAHYHEGRDDPSLRFVQEEDRDGSLARLAMIRAIGATLAAGLGILGVTPAEEMR